MDHTLTFDSTFEDAYYCDECLKDIEHDTEIRECHICNYSICIPCSLDVLRTKYV